MTHRHWHWLAAGLSLVTVTACAMVAMTVFEQLPHLEDEFANLWQASVMAEGRVRLESPEEPRSYLVPFVVDYGGFRFGKYPPGWPALLSVGVRLGAAWLVNPLLAGGAVWLIFRLARRFLSDGLAFTAALLTATSPMMLMLSGSLMSHSLGLFLTLAFVCAWLDLSQPQSQDGPTPDWMLLAAGGGGLGLLALTRPLTAVGVGLPFGLVTGIRWVRNRERRRPVYLFLLATGVAAILPLWQYALTGEPLLNPYTLWWSYDRIGFGPGIGNLSDGHTLAQAVANTRFSLSVGQHDLYGWPYLSWLLLPFGLFGLRRRPWALLLALCAASLMLAYSLYWIGSWLLGPRYYYESIFAYSLLSAAGLGVIGGFTGPVRPQPARRLAAVSLVAGMIAANVVFYTPIRLGGLHGLYGIDRASIRPLAAAELGQALIIVKSEHWSGYANLLLLGPPFESNSLRVVWSRGAEADERVRRQLPGWDVYWHDPAEPELLRSLD